jgi:hypothetical protein
MKGQWIGEYSGSNGGLIIANIDERPSQFEGVAYLNESNKSLPSTVAAFRTNNKDRQFKFRTGLIAAINPFNGTTDSWEKLQQYFGPGISIPEFADVEGSWDDKTLKLSWVTNIGTHGSCVLPRSKADQPSELVARPEARDWSGYKQYVSKLEGRRYLFRGQNEPWRLRTSFHRTGRSDLTRFLNEDIQMLRGCKKFRVNGLPLIGPASGPRRES